MFDIRKIISDKRRNYNFHTHTQFCDGHCTIGEMTASAVALGLKDLGFSPHSPLCFDSPCNMASEDVPRYFEALRHEQERYGERINIYAGMEIDYIDDSWGPSSAYFHDLNLDYAIGSVHFVPYADGKYVDIDGSFERFKNTVANFFDNDIRAVVEAFYSQSMKMIEAGGFDIIGHFDKIGHNAGDLFLGIEDEPWYESLVRKEFEAITDNHLIVEINTKAYSKCGRMFPNQRYFGWLKKYGTPVIVNSDAHYAELLNAGREEAFELLDKTE